MKDYGTKETLQIKNEQGNVVYAAVSANILVLTRQSCVFCVYYLAAPVPE